MRPMADVRQAILNVIEDENVREALKGSTDGTVDSMRYAAPEIQPEKWVEFAYEMAHVFTTPMPCGTLPQDTSWGQKAINILNASEDYTQYIKSASPW